MPKSIDQIRQQIAKLQQQERALLQKQIPEVVERIKEAVAHYGLTAEQIFGGSALSEPAPQQAAIKRTPAKRAAGPRKSVSRDTSANATKVVKGPSPAKGRKVAIKYRDNAGNVWTGRGSQPRWLRSAVEAGKRLEDFAVA